MLALDVNELTILYESTVEQYNNILKPLLSFFINIDIAIEEIDDETKARIAFAKLHTDLKIAYYRKILSSINKRIALLKNNVFSTIIRTSEIQIELKSQKSYKVCFDMKKLKDTDKKDFEFFDLTKTGKLEIALDIVMNNYNKFFDLSEYKDKNNNIYNKFDLEYRVSILTHISFYLNSLLFNLN